MARPTPVPREPVPAADVQVVVALDLEGVLTPEIWPSIGQLLVLPGLDRTTRDTGDYPSLVAERLAVVEGAGLALDQLVAAAGRLAPLPGAVDVLHRLRGRWPVVVLTDAFEQLARPLLDQLGQPFTLCHRLAVDDGGRITGAELRHPDAKVAAVAAFQGLGYRVVAAGDSHNDLGMLRAADAGCLLHPPEALRGVGLPVADDLEQLERWIASAVPRPGSTVADG